MTSISGDGYSDGALTDIQGTVNGGRMGRPPLNIEETKVRLAAGSKRRIEALVGPNKMAEFIRETVEAELDRREAEAAKGKGG